MTVTVTKINCGGEYPVRLSDFLARTVDGFWLGNKGDMADIVSFCKPDLRVAKIEVYKTILARSTPFYEWTCEIKKQIVKGNCSYSSRSCAIRGAKRFCKLIGFSSE
jgi:hypothetical protein